MSKKIILPKIRFNMIKDILNFSKYIAVNNVIWYVFYRADVFVVGKILGKEILGVYSVALQIASIPMEKISGILNQVALPAYSSIQNKKDLIASHFLKTIRLMAMIAIPALWGISSISKEIVTVILGQKWIMSTIPLQIMCLIIPFRMIHNLIASAIFGIGKPEIVLKNNLTAFLVMTLGVVIGSKWGLVGICLIWLLVYPIVFYANFSRATNALGITVYDVIKSLLKPLIFSSIMYGAVIASRNIFQLLIVDIYKMIILIFSGLFVFLLLVLLFDRKNYYELLVLIKK
jgi:O-antigen/teichoic acid export membrane protein